MKIERAVYGYPPICYAYDVLNTIPDRSPMIRLLDGGYSTSHLGRFQRCRIAPNDLIDPLAVLFLGAP